MWDADQNCRTKVKFPFNLPHEQFAESFQLDPTKWDPQFFSAADISPVFSTHEVAVANPGRACP
eukprot:4708435-Pyramimonas_sp.AAC.1